MFRKEAKIPEDEQNRRIEFKLVGADTAPDTAQARAGLDEIRNALS